MVIDRKFVFTAVNPVNGHFYTHKDAIVFCAKDLATIPALKAYRDECVALGCNREHIISIDMLIGRVEEFQINIEGRVPDTVGGEIARCIGGVGVDDNSL